MPRLSRTVRQSLLASGALPLRSESQLVTAILDELKRLNIFSWRANQIPVPRRTFRGKPGVADVLALAPDGSGRLLAIEAKLPGEQPSAAQRAFGDAVVGRGGVYVVVRSVAELRAALAAEFPQMGL